MIEGQGTTWLLYAQWRFRGIDPYVMLRGEGAVSPWPERVEALRAAFAVHAAVQEGMVGDALGALGTGAAAV